MNHASRSSLASWQISPSWSAEKSIMMWLPSILSSASCCHSGPMALPGPVLQCLIFLMSAVSSGLALKRKPLLMSCVLMIFSSLQSSLLPLLKISSRASSVLSNSFSMACVFSGLSCSYLQSLVRQEQTLIRISGARSMFALIYSGLLKISERTVKRSCLMVFIQLNSYSIVVEFSRFLRMLTYSLSSRPPLIGYSSFLSRASVSICRWQLFLRIFCSKMGTISLTSAGVRSYASVRRVLVLLVLTLTMLWVMFLMMFLRHCLKSNFLPTFATKKPMPLVQLEAIFSLSLQLCLIMQSRHYFSCCQLNARANTFVLAQLDNPQVILTIEFSDLYCLESSSSVLMDLEVMLSVWNSGQKETYPSNLMRATLTKELFLMVLMEGKSVAVYCSSTNEEKQWRRKALALAKVGSVQQSQSTQVRVDSNLRQLLTVTSRQQVSMNLRRKAARVSCLMLGSHLALVDWLLMSCSSSKQPLKISSTNSLQLQLIVSRKLAISALQIDSSPCTLKKIMLKYFLDSRVKQLMISLTSLSSLRFLLLLLFLRMSMTWMSLWLMLALLDLKYFSSISTHRLLLLTSTERKLMQRVFSSSSSRMLHSNSRTGMMQLLMSSPMPSSKDILSMRLQLLHNSHNVLKIIMMICKFFQQYSANSRKYSAFRSPEKMMKDFGTKEDLVDFSSFSTQALYAAAMSFLPSKLAIMLSRQLMELLLTLLFLSKIDSRMRLWSPKLLRIRLTISRRTSALIFAYSTVRRSCFTWPRNYKEMMLEVTHISQQVSMILAQCLKRKARRAVALIRIFWWAEFILRSRLSSFDSLSPSSQSEHSDMLEKPPCKQAVSKLKFSQLQSLRLPKILSWKVSLPRKHSLNISLIAFSKSTSPTLTTFSPLLAYRYFSSSVWQKARKMSTLLMDLMKSRLSMCWQMVMQRLLSIPQTILIVSSKNRKCLLARPFSNSTVTASKIIFSLLYSIFALLWQTLPSSSVMFFSSSSSLRTPVILLPSLIHSSHCLYLNSCTCMFDLLMFFEVSHIPLFFCLAASRRPLYSSIFSFDKYFSAFLESSAYPSSIIFSSITTPSLLLFISPYRFTSSLYFYDPETVSSMNSPSSCSRKQDCARSHISLGWMLAILMSLSSEKQKVTYLRLLRLTRSSLRHSTLLTKHSSWLCELTSLLMYSLLAALRQQEVSSLPSSNSAPRLYSSLILLLLFFSSEYSSGLRYKSCSRCQKLLFCVVLSSTLSMLLSCWSWMRNWKGEMTLSMRQRVASSMLLQFEFI